MRSITLVLGILVRVSVPVEPKPPSPRCFGQGFRVSFQATRVQGATTSWAMRMPRSTVKGVAVIDQDDADFAPVIGVDRARGC